MQPSAPGTGTSKMSVRSKMEEQARPHAIYKREFLQRVLSDVPESLLDVGCGEGALLRAAAAAGCSRCTGIEPDESMVLAGRAQGLDLRQGRAEALPFPNGSYDVVVFDYVAHHLEFLEQALYQAARVARRAVFVLDTWYDVSHPSQQVAMDFDGWLKVIDRRRGLVHNPCVQAVRLAAPFVALGGFRIDYSHRLLLQGIDISKVERVGREQLALIGGCAVLERALLTLLDRARLDRFTDDGALMFCASRR
ncbi:class I SAM-dependent methyltransferase [Steroidobacter sp. S1-65]|uniref:Class I SAM-dependent methyltransferase n=1 Tax=Steroidobacter gossypii TaxID=2805490 RepID=A0ABS1WVH0_9GAMM|nr:class I SAM-dependent methyltransferase [Steroidobacter gossypii]MBM0104964.1 class I SAM-dependent methyltransferase [Steroidobacter gossypii]